MKTTRTQDLIATAIVCAAAALGLIGATAPAYAADPSTGLGTGFCDKSFIVKSTGESDERSTETQHVVNNPWR